MNKGHIPGEYRLAAQLLLVCLLIGMPLLVQSENPGQTEDTGQVFLPLIELARDRPLPYPNCRYGSVALWNPVEAYDIASLNLGWYLSAPRLHPLNPHEASPIHLIRLKGRDCPFMPYEENGVIISCPHPEYWSEAIITPTLTADGLGQVVDENPGGIWLVGNEPDRPYFMDDVLPSQYAQAYHDTYNFIKQRDPSALVGVGGIVVPTPLRLQYLDMILGEYQSRYGRTMPVDVWNTHIHIVREVKDSWGADIPPGIDETVGTLFTKSQHADLATFQQLIFDFRAWMKGRGQQDKPLIISEFGILWPEWLNDEFGNPFDAPRVIAFMQETMAWLDGYADSELGYPADNHRLVQRWNWYSLDDDAFLPPPQEDFRKWNGWLFESDTLERSVFGDSFAQFTSQIWPARDLVPYHFQLNPLPGPTVSPSGTATVTLQIDILNSGNTLVDRSFTVAVYERIGSTLDLVATTTITNPVPGCAGMVTAQIEWPNANLGPHQLSVTVDSTERVGEVDEGNNTLEKLVFIADHQLCLPLLDKK